LNLIRRSIFPSFLYRQEMIGHHGHDTLALHGHDMPVLPGGCIYTPHPVPTDNSHMIGDAAGQLHPIGSYGYGAGDRTELHHNYNNARD